MSLREAWNAGVSLMRLIRKERRRRKAKRKTPKVIWTKMYIKQSGKWKAQHMDMAEKHGLRRCIPSQRDRDVKMASFTSVLFLLDDQKTAMQSTAMECLVMATCTIQPVECCGMPTYHRPRCTIQSLMNGFPWGYNPLYPL